MNGACKEAIWLGVRPIDNDTAIGDNRKRRAFWVTTNHRTEAYLPSVTVGEKSGRNTVISVKSDDKSIKTFFIRY